MFTIEHKHMCFFFTKDQTFLSFIFYSHYNNKIKIPVSNSENDRDRDLQLALQCLIGALSDNTDAVNKMREQQERTSELVSSLAKSIDKREEQQMGISKTYLAEIRTLSEQMKDSNIQRTVHPLSNSTLMETNQSNNSENSIK